jgi:hypothetical protein
MLLSLLASSPSRLLAYSTTLLLTLPPFPAPPPSLSRLSVLHYPVPFYLPAFSCPLLPYYFPGYVVSEGESL